MNNGNDVADGILGIITMLGLPTVNWAGVRLILASIQQFDTLAAYASTTSTIRSIDDLAACASDLEKAAIVAGRTDSPVAEMKIIMNGIASKWIDAARLSVA